MKKILAIFTVFILVIVLFAGCGKADDTQSGSSQNASIGSSSPSSSQTANTTSKLEPITSLPEGVKIAVNNKNLADYDIVVPRYNRSYYVIREIDELNKYLEDTYQFTLKILEDHEKTDKPQIIVGDCDREGVEAITDHTKYSIKTEGDNIFINGGRNYSTATAFEIFTEMVKSGTIVIIENKTGNTSDGLGSDGYRLVWTDEFDKDLDPKIWEVADGEGAYYTWYDRKVYRSDHPSVIRCENGKLYHCAGFDEFYWYGTMVASKGMRFTKGFMEISSNLADGDGIWHAFWTWSDDPDHLEFDIMECWSGGKYFVNYLHEFRNNNNILIYGENNEDPNSYVLKEKHGTADQMWGTNGVESMIDWDAWWKPDYPNMYDEMHTFACEWNDIEVNYFRDGELTMKYVYADTKNEFLYNKPHFFHLSMLVGSNYANQPDDEKSTTGVKKPDLNGEYWTNGRNTWTIEYIQLFQKEGMYLHISK